jgi:tetratricopeptide (TPR) repeat protein
MGKLLDARSDLFSFGSVLYEMVTGRRAFGTDTGSPVASLTAVLRDTPPSPAALNPAIPPALDRLVMRLLEKSPDNRPAAAADVKAELSRSVPGASAQSASALSMQGSGPVSPYPYQPPTQPVSPYPATQPMAGYAGSQAAYPYSAAQGPAPSPLPASYPLTQPVAPFIQPAAPAAPGGESPLFAEGRQALKQWTAASLARAKDCFEQAIRTEQNRGAVYAAMSEYYATAATLGLREPADAMPKAEWAAQKAVEIDSGCEQAQVTLGIVTGYFKFRWEQAKTHFAHVRSPESKLRYAMWFLRPLGMFAECENLLKGDELSLAWVALEQGSPEAAAEHASQSGQHHWIAAWVFSWALLERGCVKEAVDLCQRGLQLEPGQPYLEATLATALAKQGQSEAARRMLRPEKRVPAWFGIPVHAALGDPDSGFAAARESVQRRDAGVITALRMPGTAAVRTGVRFGELVREMRLDVQIR